MLAEFWRARSMRGLGLVAPAEGGADELSAETSADPSLMASIWMAASEDVDVTAMGEDSARPRIC